MIILDTNVLSALMQTSPDSAVVTWLDRQAADSIWITTITVFEARLGVAALPAGRRRKALDEALGRVISDDLEHRILEFDTASAVAAAGLAASRRARGRPVDLRDTLIAGIAVARNATLATRNVRHFADLDVPVVDPWAS